MPAITEHVTTQEERDLLELPVRLGGLALVNPARTSGRASLGGTSFELVDGYPDKGDEFQLE